MQFATRIFTIILLLKYSRIRYAHYEVLLSRVTLIYHVAIAKSIQITREPIMVLSYVLDITKLGLSGH